MRSAGLTHADIQAVDRRTGDGYRLQLDHAPIGSRPFYQCTSRERYFPEGPITSPYALVREEPIESQEY